MSSSVGQEIPRLLWNRKIHYRVHKSLKIINKTGYHTHLASILHVSLGQYSIEFHPMNCELKIFHIREFT
jgi:hypothetical protein